MNVPAIAKQTYDELKDLPEYQELVDFILDNLSKFTDSYVRAKLIHEIVEEFNKEAFSHPLVKELSPCKKGCSACCHSQVSVTSEEAELLARRVLEGVPIDSELLKRQMGAKNDSDEYFKITYDDRRCVFLDQEGSCRVYEDRPSVCRTNAVIGDASQCSTRFEVKPTRLVKTPKANLAIYAAFKSSPASGTLPYMLGKILELSEIDG